MDQSTITDMFNQLCKYKDMLGKPNEGLHSYRVFDIAIIDVLFTIVAGWLISKIWNMKFMYVLIGLFILGIVMHRIFCVRTKIDKLLFSV